ncbi:MAG: GntR family transcriptional regulator [Bryobacteraceae bacterium]
MPRKLIRSDSSTPIRSQLRELLLSEVRQGRFVPGGRISSERELADRYCISRASVRESITELIQSGILFRTVGKGTFVSPGLKIDSDGMIPQPHREARNIGFVISENIFRFVQTGYDRILGGVQDVCRERNWRLSLNLVGEDSKSPGLLAIRSNGTRSLDGCIVVGGIRRNTLDHLRQENIPTVLVDLLLSDEAPELAAVTIDYAAGTRTAIRHLHGLGHRTIGYVGFPGSEKYQAYWQSLEEFGLAYEPRHVEFFHLLDLEPGILAGFHAMQRMIARKCMPSAILVTNDFAALGVMEALGVAGMRIPGEISVVGFDDLVQKTSPPLTTVRVDLHEVGRLAGNKLFEKLGGENIGEERVVVPVELMIRGTTSAPENDASRQSASFVSNGARGSR